VTKKAGRQADAIAPLPGAEPLLREQRAGVCRVLTFGVAAGRELCDRCAIL
jgi:hypothetical protein